VKTDAKHVNATDKCGYKTNRDLAEMISKAMQAKKNSDKNGAHSCWAGVFIRTRSIRAGRARMIMRVDVGVGAAREKKSLSLIEYARLSSSPEYTEARPSLH